MSTAHDSDLERAGPFLLAGRTAATEWVSLLLRRAGREVRLLEPRAEGVAVRAAWSEDAEGDAESFPSVAAAAAAHDTSALFIDYDDREGWPDGVVPEELPCPAVVISAFGRGPDAPRGGTLTVSAASGVLHLTGASGDPEGRPLLLHDRQTETIAGSYAAIALLLAASRSRPGHLIELTKHECFSICSAGEVVKWTYAGLSPTRLGSALFQPMEVMSASDGDLFVLCTSEEQWQRLMREMGDPEWASWEIFAHRGLRGENWDVLEPRLAEWMATRSCDELMDLALRERLPFAFALAPRGVEELEEEMSGSADVRDWLYRSTPSPQSAPPAPGSPGARAADLARPLEGVTVLDLSTVWATPLSTAQLAHFGARVIKVESQYRLDHTRSRIGELSLPDAHLPEWDRKGSFRETNQGKESATVNLGTAEGQRLLLDLAGQADVIVSNFTPGVAERLGLSAEALWEANPGLIIGRLSAYHPDSHLSRLVGFGYAMLLACGFGYQGEGEPWIDRSIAYPDPQAGFVLAFAMVDALQRRERSGRGALIEVDLFGPSAAMHRYLGRSYPPSEGAPRPLDAARGFELAAPAFSECLPCRHEEWVAVVCESGEEVARLASVLGADGPAAGESPRELARRLGQVSVQREAQQLEALLRDRGLAAQRVLDLRQLVREAGLTSAAHASSGLFRVPEGERHIHAASPWVLDGERYDSNRRAPRLGEHTPAVLADLLGLAPDAIADLETRKVAW
ncbi:MAG: hypothetical protein F4X25_08845 [Chloroflexi bacterium]|nr:hypothetical protein [Chloroflexota bacterium]